MTIHVVQPGETLSSLSRYYGLPLPLLASINGISPDARLAVGQTLVIREPLIVHTVAPGDTIYALARRYGTTVRELYRNNVSLGGQPLLRTGEPVVVSFSDHARLGTIQANAYAYSYIDHTLLDTALPYLSYLTPFTYGVSSSGRLLPLDDASMLDAAARHRAAPLMHLSSLTEEGGFSNERSSLVLNNDAVQTRLIEDILETMTRKGYRGLDVDFEFVFPEERIAYAAFIRTLRAQLAPLGYPVLVALAPKTRADQPGLLYEAHDYALLGAAADAVLLMTYEWGKVVYTQPVSQLYRRTRGVHHDCSR